MSPEVHRAVQLKALKECEQSFIKPWWRSDQTHYLLGVDETAKGPIAGPLGICCVYVPSDVYVSGVKDSKAFSGDAKESSRNKVGETLRDAPGVVYSVFECSAKSIDRMGITQAWTQCIRGAIKSVQSAILTKDPTAVFDVLLDGDYVPLSVQNDPELPGETMFTSVIKGDGKCYCIAAASIIAKTHVDKRMRMYDKMYPGYGFAQHKGAPSKSHKDAIARLGLTPIHRSTFIHT